jgi:N,N'-diacetylchitobiose phosphorylase
VGGRTGLGYRDTAQDAMCVPHSAPATVKRRLTELLRGLTDKGYGLHLFDPAWFEKTKVKPFKSPTVVPEKPLNVNFDDLTDVCSDDALWLIPAVVEYLKETGEFDFLNETYSYANGGEGSVLEHMK